MIEVVARTAEEVFIPLTVGGGVRTLDDARGLLRVGADKISVNSAAVASPDLINELSDTFGAQCVVVGIDVRRSPSRFEVYTHGGRVATGIDAIAWAEECEARGAGEVVLNSMDRDGTRAGFDLELTRLVVDTVGIPVVASGGVGCLRAPGRRCRCGRRRCRARGVDLPFRGGHRGRSQGDAGGGRGGRSPSRVTAMATSHGLGSHGTGSGSPKQAIQMLTDRVLVQIPTSEGERRSRAGILIPATAQVARRLAWAEVVAAGPHVRSIKPGDQVLFNPEDRYEVEVQGEDYLILRERDIHAVASERVDDGTGLYL